MWSMLISRQQAAGRRQHQPFEAAPAFLLPAACRLLPAGAHLQPTAQLAILSLLKSGEWHRCAKAFDWQSLAADWGMDDEPTHRSGSHLQRRQPDRHLW